MDQIEVIIKLQTKSLMNYMLIGRSDKIEKLKQLCEKISDVPPEQQILIYKGNILSNDKIISDYNIDNGAKIILNKKEEPLQENFSLFQNFDNSNLKHFFSNNNRISISKNENINFNEISKILKQIPDFSSVFMKMDFDKLKDYYISIGCENYLNTLGVQPKKGNQCFNDPKILEIMNNMIKDPLLLKKACNTPEMKKIIQSLPLLKLALQNPEKVLAPEVMQMVQNLFKKDEKRMIESSNTGFSVPPDPFENSQILNSSEKNNIN